MSVALPAGPSAHTRGTLLVLLAGAFWSIGGLVVRLIEEASEWQIVFYRSLALTATLLLVIAWRERERGFARVFRRAGGTAVLAGFCLSLGFAGWIFALTHTSVANAMFLLATQPFMVAILALLVLGERVMRITWITMAIAAGGIVLMVGEGVALGTLFGNLMALVAAAGFSGFTVALRRGREHDMFPAVCWAGVFSCLTSGAMLVLSDEAFAMRADDLGLCVLLGVVQIGCGLMLYTVGSRHLPAAELSLLALTEVILGPIWVWLALGEVPGSATLLGGAIVLFAVSWRAAHAMRRAPPLGIAS